MLRVKLFARVRDLVGSPEIQIDWTDGQNVQMLRSRLSELYPALESLLPSLLVAVNNDYGADSTPLASTDEVACFPPVSGG